MKLAGDITPRPVIDISIQKDDSFRRVQAVDRVDRGLLKKVIFIPLRLDPFFKVDDFRDLFVLHVSRLGLDGNFFRRFYRLIDRHDLPLSQRDTRYGGVLRSILGDRDTDTQAYGKEKERL
ncbi:MAG: hypothetical protein J6W10_01985, partial [Kiritimatiellae bacterium]|nr:hypothetical protein [Kiritimatiellia bacterium]